MPAFSDYRQGSGGSKVGNFLRNNQQAIGSIGGGVLGALFSIGARKKAFKRSKQLMDKQFQMDKDMWDYQNAYNTPVQQMQRLKDAGLNPALMYGQGTTGNANNMVQSKFQELSPYTSSQDIAQSTAAGIQLAMANSQKKLLDNQANLAMTDAVVKTRDQKNKNKLTNYQSALLESQTAKEKQQVKNMIEEQLATIEKTKLSKQQRLNEKAKAEISRIDADFLKKNRTSTYELNLYRAAKSIFFDTTRTLQWWAQQLGKNINIKG